MRAFAVAAVTLLAAPALADEPRGPHKEGDYGGVVPGQPQRVDTPTKGKPRRPAAKGTLSWIGFEAKDGGSQIFLQSIAPFEVSQRLDGATLVVHLTGVSRLGHNVWRPIDTRFFDTPVARVVARQVGAAHATKTQPAHGAGIEVRVAFKTAKDAHEGTLRTATEPDGLYYVYLGFGAASGSKDPTLKDPER